MEEEEDEEDEEEDEEEEESLLSPVVEEIQRYVQTNIRRNCLEPSN